MNLFKTLAMIGLVGVGMASESLYSSDLDIIQPTLSPKKRYAFARREDFKDDYAVLVCTPQNTPIGHQFRSVAALYKSNYKNLSSVWDFDERFVAINWSTKHGSSEVEVFHRTADGLKECKLPDLEKCVLANTADATGLSRIYPVAIKWTKTGLLNLDLQAIAIKSSNGNKLNTFNVGYAFQIRFLPNGESHIVSIMRIFVSDNIPHTPMNLFKNPIESASTRTDTSQTLAGTTESPPPADS